MKICLLQLLLLSLLVSCLDVGGTRTSRSKIDGSADDRPTPTATPIMTPTPIPTLPPSSIDLRGIVDPVDGRTKAKVTIPKNYKGWMHLYVLNIAALKSKFVYVRFNFGKNRTPVTLPAVVGIPTGMVPEINIDMLMVNMESAPFNEIRNLYHLYDYGDYDSDNDGIEELPPATDELDPNLYCRGLNLSDDHTFVDSDNNGRCDNFNDKCLYSYASIIDRSVGDNRVNGPAINFSNATPFKLEDRNATRDRWPCLPDDNNSSMLLTSLGGSSQVSITGGSYLYRGEVISVLGFDSYIYNGPYRRLDSISSWQISDNAMFSKYGLFKGMFPGGDNGFKSLLFPRAGKMDLKDGVTYIGSTTPFGIKSAMTNYGGTTNYVDGCNIRALNSNFDDPEKSFSSCSVTATIEILERVNGEYQKLSEVKSLKLQLTRASKKDSDGNQLLVESMKSCHSESECSSSECCYNGHCLSNSIVPSCKGDTTPTGNRGIGELCSSDMDCVSLCCDENLGTCNVHLFWDDGDETPRTCSKSPGQSCVAKGWCRTENISTCMIVKTGVDPASGRISCGVRCYNVPTHGDCINSICYPPVTPPYPNFDPANPDCSTAVNPPTHL